jgi:hypothetical protein
VNGYSVCLAPEKKSKIFKKNTLHSLNLADNNNIRHSAERKGVKKGND